MSIVNLKCISFIKIGLIVNIDGKIVLLLLIIEKWIVSYPIIWISLIFGHFDSNGWKFLFNNKYMVILIIVLKKKYISIFKIWLKIWTHLKFQKVKKNIYFKDGLYFINRKDLFNICFISRHNLARVLKSYSFEWKLLAIFVINWWIINTFRIENIIVVNFDI